MLAALILPTLTIVAGLALYGLALIGD